LPRLRPRNVGTAAASLSSHPAARGALLESGIPLRAAIVGCGRVAERHARILASFPDAEIVAMVDSSPAVAMGFAAAHGGRPYSDLATMVVRERPDLVAVCAPSGAHAEITLDLIRLGVANVVVEKPMALRVSDADAMVAASERTGANLFVVKQNRYNRPVVKLRETLDSGRFGKLVLGAVRVRWCRRQEYYSQAAWRGTWALDGGVFANQASHHIDLLVSLMGAVESVSAFAATRLVDIEAEDTGVALLKFRSGALGVVEATTAARPGDLEGSLSILGENGTVEVGGFALNEMTVWRFADSGPEDETILEEYRTNPPDVYGFGHHQFLRDVVDSIRMGLPPGVDGREGRKSLEVIAAIYESIETGREVRLPFEQRASRLGRTSVSSTSR
jgi:UDP-N-acetyl-2-amino-2-deoxyglucuronate dehydrogenase